MYFKIKHSLRSVVCFISRAMDGFSPDLPIEFSELFSSLTKLSEA